MLGMPNAQILRTVFIARAQKLAVTNAIAAALLA